MAAPLNNAQPNNAQRSYDVVVEEDYHKGTNVRFYWLLEPGTTSLKSIRDLKPEEIIQYFSKAQEYLAEIQPQNLGDHLLVVLKQVPREQILAFLAHVYAPCSPRLNFTRVSSFR